MMPCHLKGIDGSCQGLSYYLRAIQNRHIHGPIFFFFSLSETDMSMGIYLFGLDIKLVLPDKLSNTVAIDPCTVAAAELQPVAKVLETLYRILP